MFNGENGNDVCYSDLLIHTVAFNAFLKQNFPTIRNQPIGVFGDKAATLLVYAISVLQSGNGYVPLNAGWPIDRLTFIVKESRMQACVVQNRLLKIFIDALAKAGLPCETSEIGENHTFIKLDQRQRKYPKQLTYILFTSGSTGFPKGIVHTSDGMTAFLKWCKKEFGKYKLNRFVSIAPLNFDLSVFDVFYPLLNKKQLYLPTSDTLANTRLFVQYLVKNKIEVIYTTPSYLKLLLQTAQLQKYDLGFVKLILIAGEQLTSGLVNEMQTHFKKAVMYNLYGPTETNVCTYYKVDLKKLKSDIVPIGKPCTPSGIKMDQSGELLYKGKLLMKAFINEKGMTKISAAKFYKTGDVVKLVSAGNYEFVGRKDQMIKRNGFRIEPNEIKKALLTCKGVTNCEVMEGSDHTVIAAVKAGGTASELQLKSECVEKLPAYMLPDRIVVLPEFPISLNHKTDIKKLKEIISNFDKN